MCGEQPLCYVTQIFLGCVSSTISALFLTTACNRHGRTATRLHSHGNGLSLRISYTLIVIEVGSMLHHPSLTLSLVISLLP
jgi:hypothetical protein